MTTRSSDTLAVDLHRVRVTRHPREPYRALGSDSFDRAEEALVRVRKRLAGHVVMHINSSRDDGVAAIIRSVVGYTRDGGLNANWVVASIDHDFGVLSRRLYNHLYGSAGDGGPLGEDEHALYRDVAEQYARELPGLIHPGDVAFLHDAPVGGFAAAAKAAGAHVVWRCHLGVDQPNEHVERAWEFLRPYVSVADAYAFSRPQHVWEGLDPDKVAVLRPSLDPLSPKNQDLSNESALAILDQIGLTDSGVSAAPVFTRSDGSPSRVDHRAQIDQLQPVPSGGGVVAQVSGWERLKDHLGLLEAFGAHCRTSTAHLILAGPRVKDGPGNGEQEAVLRELRERLDVFPAEVGERVHIVQLPMDDLEENATMVNALQRRADVIVHKSRAEGFGLSVTEAMWKARPVLASRVGGIQDQIIDGESGVLIDDPDDLAAFANAIDELLGSPQLRESLGAAARARVGESFLTSAHVASYLELIESLLDDVDRDG